MLVFDTARYVVGETVSIPSEYSAGKFECAVVLTIENEEAKLAKEVTYTLRVHRTGKRIQSDVFEMRPCRLTQSQLRQLDLERINAV